MCRAQLVLGQLFGQSPKVLLSIAPDLCGCIVAVACSLFTIERGTFQPTANCLVVIHT